MSNIFTEFNICLLLVIIPINELEITQTTRNNIDDVLVSIVYIIMGGNMLLSILMTGKKLIYLIKMKRAVIPITSITTQKVTDGFNFKPRLETMPH